SLLSHDRRHIVGAVSDGSIVWWNAATGAVERIFAGRSHDVDTLAFSSDGRFLAAGGGRSAIEVWDLQSGGLARRLSGTGTTSALAFTADGQAIAAGRDGSLRRRNATTGELL